MGSFIQVPKQEMIVLGDRLNYIRSMLEAQKNSGRIIDGLDSEHGREHVMIAEEGFVDAWETAIKNLLEAIGGTGDLAKSIGLGAAQIDSGVADAGNKASNDLSGFNFHI